MVFPQKRGDPPPFMAIRFYYTSSIHNQILTSL